MQRLEWKSAHHAELSLGIVTWSNTKKKLKHFFFGKSLEQLIEW